MKTNYIGILGAVIAFICLVLPWWTMNLSFSVGPISTSAQTNFYLYQLANSVTGFSLANTWYYNWIAFALVLVGAILAAAGSVMEKGRPMLAIGGVLEIIAMIIFTVGLMMDLPDSGFTGLGLFSSGTTVYGLIFPVDFSTYLSYGFWLALVAVIVTFAGAAWKPKEISPALPTSVPPTPTS